MYEDTDAKGGKTMKEKIKKNIRLCACAGITAIVVVLVAICNIGKRKKIQTKE